VETTVRNVTTFDRASDGDISANHELKLFPIAQFIANLRLLPDLRCYTHFDSLKSVDEVKAEYLIDSKRNI
jgi:hypothetical protein